MIVPLDYASEAFLHLTFPALWLMLLKPKQTDCWNLFMLTQQASPTALKPLVIFHYWNGFYQQNWPCLCEKFQLSPHAVKIHSRGLAAHGNSESSTSSCKGQVRRTMLCYTTGSSLAPWGLLSLGLKTLILECGLQPEWDELDWIKGIQGQPIHIFYMFIRHAVLELCLVWRLYLLETSYKPTHSISTVGVGYNPVYFNMSYLWIIMVRILW